MSAKTDDVQAAQRVSVGRVLVGVDGSDRSRDALALGQALHAPDSRLLVAYVHPFGELSSLLGDGHVEQLVRETVQSVARDLYKVLDGRIERELRTVGGRSPAERLHELALEIGAGVIAVGSSQRSTLGRVVVGSVAEALLSGGAPVPVAVAPEGFARASRTTPSIIGCAFDGSAEARAALRFAEVLAGQVGGSLRIVGVHHRLTFGDVSVSGSFGYRSANDAARDALQASLTKAARHLDPRVRATVRLLDGDVAATLIAYSSQVDVLVTGSRGYGPVRRVFAGSVSRALVRPASCPTVVVPRPGHDEAEYERTS
jgi:nucleotide-binding universal stress UspA family protein